MHYSISDHILIQILESLYHGLLVSKLVERLMNVSVICVAVIDVECTYVYKEIFGRRELDL